MNDLYLDWGADLVVGSGGDLALANGQDKINQRIYRRLLTNPGEYIWKLDYGGGLAQFVGSPARPEAIEAVIRAQLEMETAIPSGTLPHVKANVLDRATGNVNAEITYFDPTSARSIRLNVTPE